MAGLSPPDGFWRAVFKRRHLFQIAMWPLFCAAMTAVLWGLVFTKLEADRRRIEGSMFNQAVALSRAVAKGLSLSLMHVDELSKSLQSRWEHAKTVSNLSELAQYSALDRQSLTFIGILDKTGQVVIGSTDTSRLGGFGDEDYFLFHKNQLDRTLQIRRNPTARTAGGVPAIEFTRRLDGPDGSFDGVVVVSVRPAYLTGFYDEASFGKRGYLGIRDIDGELLAASMSGKEVFKALLHEAPFRTERNGSRLLANPHWLGSKEKGLVAWQQIAPYPLVVIIGLAEDEILMQYRMMAANYINGAAAASWFLLVSALAGTLLTMLLIWRKQQTREIREAYRFATEGANEGFFFLRAVRDKAGDVVDFVIEDCNQTGAALGGVRPDQLIGSPLSALPNITDFVLPADVPSQVLIGRKAMDEGVYQDEWAAPAASDFRGLWLDRKMVRIGNGLAVTLRDISAAKAHERNLLTMAHEDALTKLPNRHWLMSFLPGALARARENGGQVALFFIDIDNFKHVNDTLGHAAGDALLHVAAMRLKSELRPGDSLARLGGDEFTIVLEYIAEARDARLVAERIVDSFKHPIELSGGKAFVGSSIGISLFPEHGEDIDTLLRHADIAMYAAKAAGKGRYCFYENQQYQSLMNRINSQIALENALKHDQFVMYYQPRLSSKSGEICGIEALVRWQNPERGLLSPIEFIALAESTGLILRLGKLVMEKVCAQVEQWEGMHLPMVPVSFNVSASEFNQGDVKGSLALCLERHHIKPASIELELTETMLVDDKGDAANVLAAIRSMGVKCLVDDFGTGFSSLSQLQRFDTDVLKIDQSFTAQLGRTKKAETFFRAIVSMAHALEMGVVAEGVETIEQLRLSRMLGCEEVQGYYICPPVPAAEMASLLRRRFMMNADGVMI